jgi:hypothetical protein
MERGWLSTRLLEPIFSLITPTADPELVYHDASWIAAGTIDQLS